MKRILYFFLLLGVGLLYTCEIENLHEAVENTPPTADFLPSTTSCTPPCEVVFTNQSNNATAYVWDFGDGSPSVTEENPTHTFTTVGNYNVQLTAANGSGATDSVTKQVAVATDTGGGNCNVVASFEISTTGDCKAPCAVNFVNNSVNATSYLWDFGDGTTSTLANPSAHTYTETGTFTISLTAIKNENCQEMTTKSQTVVWNTFEANYGGVGNESGRAIIETMEGDFIIVGSTKISGTSSQLQILKVDRCGNEIWTKDISTYELGSSIIETREGDYIIVGAVSNGNNTQIFLIKINTDGNIIREAILDYTDMGFFMWSRDIVETQEGNYIIVGETSEENRRIFLLETTDGGTERWLYFFGEEGYNVTADDLIKTSDRGYVLVGGKFIINGESSAYILKTNTLGEQLWTRSSSIEMNGANGVKEIINGDYIIVGGTITSTEDVRTSVLRLNSNGNIEWEKTLGGTSPEAAWDIVETLNGNYVIAGLQADDTEDFDFAQWYLFEMTAEGTIVWRKNAISTINPWNFYPGNMLTTTLDGGYAFVSSTRDLGNGEQILLLKTDAEGKIN